MATLIVTTGKAIVTNRIKGSGTEPSYVLQQLLIQHCLLKLVLVLQVHQLNKQLQLLLIPIKWSVLKLLVVV